MANKILIKRSNSHNQTPGAGDLDYGELAINTYDGRIFAKVNSGSGATVADLKENDTISLSGDDIVSASGKTAITVNLNTSGVTAGTYGSKNAGALQIPTFTVDTKGRITSASYVTYSASGDFGTIATQNANNVSISGGAIDTTTIGATNASTGKFTTLESTANLNVGGDAIIAGNLYVKGVTTTVDSTTVAVGDLNITLAKDAVTQNQADGAGITVNGANATITWDSTYQAWNLNKKVRVTGTGNFTGNIYTDADVVATGNVYGKNINLTGSLTSTNAVDLTGNVRLGAVTADSIDNTPIGNTTRSTGKFTSVFSNDVADKQIVFGTNDKLTGTTGFTYNSGTETLTATNISSSGTAGLKTVKVSDLTSGRVTFATTDGQLTDSNDLRFNSGTGKLSATSFSGQIVPTLGNTSSDGIQFPGNPGGGTGDAASIRYYADPGEQGILELRVINDGTDIIKLYADGGVTVVNTLKSDHLQDLSLTSGRVTFAGTDGLLKDNSNLTFNGFNQLGLYQAVATSTIEAQGFIDKTLTNTRVVVVGTDGRLVDNSTFTFNTSTNVLTVANLNITGGLTNTGLTSGRVPVAGASGVLLDDSGLTFDVSTHKLTVTKTEVTGLATFGNVVTLTADTAYTQGTYDTGTFQVVGDVSVDGFMQIKDNLRVAGTIYKNGYEVINTQDTIDGGTF